MTNLREISADELKEHDQPQSCWMAINGRVFDITSWLRDHPGGPNILLKSSGKDATDAFKQYHSLSILETLPRSSIIGLFKHSDTRSVQEGQRQPNFSPNVPLSHILNVYDFARNAKKRLSKEAWDYLVSASDDEVSYRYNEFAFNRIWLKPRVLVNVFGFIDTSVNLFGTNSPSPIYISATAMGRLYHPDGEMAICLGAQKAGIIQMCPTLASCDLEEMVSVRTDKQTQWFQLYVNENWNITSNSIKRAESLGMKALCVTVDVAVLGKRERDQRNKVLDISSIQKIHDQQADRSKGVSRSLSSFVYSGFDWEYLKRIRGITKLPIILKGIQTIEDALLAYKSGLCKGIIVSNHGGRQVDFARPTIDCLSEIVSGLRAHCVKVNSEFDVYVDGGIRRGTDIYKCLALGAKAVGIGRPSLFALASHGPEGINHLVSLLTDELKMTMMHMGCMKLSDIAERSLSIAQNGQCAIRTGTVHHESNL